MRRRWYYIKRAIRADRPFFAAAAVLFLMAALAVGSRDWLGAAVSRYGDQYGFHGPDCDEGMDPGRQETEGKKRSGSAGAGAVFLSGIHGDGNGTGCRSGL